MGGYMEKLAWIDLSTQTVKVEELSEEIRRKYIGGTGLAAYIFRQTLFHKIDPLGPENILIFATGPLTGTGIPTSGRYAVAASRRRPESGARPTAAADLARRSRPRVTTPSPSEAGLRRLQC